MSNKRPKQYSRRSNAAKLSKRQLYGIAIVAIIAISSLAVYAFFTQARGTELRAAIVDQLSSRLDYTNATFVKTANATLTAAGYAVTYYKGSDVTVDFYRYLPKMGYNLIILRVHTALYYNETSRNLEAPLDLFTSELYDPKNYPYDQAQRYLDVAMYQSGAPPSGQFFGIKYSFIANAMQGSFDNTTIIMMGCNGLDKYWRANATLQAFVGKGVKAIIGWDEAVGVVQTDIATNRLLNRLLMENQTIKDAVNATNMDVGPDPTYHSVLTYYPLNSNIGGYLIPRSPTKAAASTSVFLILGTVMFSALSAPSITRKFRLSKRFRMQTF